jgi:hypothetical protein
MNWITKMVISMKGLQYFQIEGLWEYQNMKNRKNKKRQK